jgi:hypothetical protein
LETPSSIEIPRFHTFKHKTSIKTKTTNRRREKREDQKKNKKKENKRKERK